MAEGAVVISGLFLCLHCSIHSLIRKRTLYCWVERVFQSPAGSTKIQLPQINRASLTARLWRFSIYAYIGQNNINAVTIFLLAKSLYIFGNSEYE